MPQGSIRVSKPLTNLSIHYTNSTYIAQEVLGNLPVKNESDLYWVYNSDWRMADTARANGALANQVTWEASTSSYVMTEHSLKDILTDRDYNNADSALQLEKHTSENLIDKILLRLEYESAKMMFTTTTFSNNATLNTNTSWNYNTTTSAPIQNLLSATGYIVQQSGKMPNKVVMGWSVFESLKENNNVYSRIQYTDRALLTKELMASMFDVEKVHVGTAARNTSKEGIASDKSFIWGGDAVVGYFKPRPGLRDVTAATIIRQNSLGNPYKVKKWREEDVSGNYIEVQSMHVPKAIATSCAYLFKTAALY
jgi:hypothetical protein